LPKKNSIRVGGKKNKSSKENVRSKKKKIEFESTWGEQKKRQCPTKQKSSREGISQQLHDEYYIRKSRRGGQLKERAIRVQPRSTPSDNGLDKISIKKKKQGRSRSWTRERVSGGPKRDLNNKEDK